jgi:hypothetical protein
MKVVRQGWWLTLAVLKPDDVKRETVEFLINSCA